MSKIKGLVMALRMTWRDMDYHDRLVVFVMALGGLLAGFAAGRILL